MTRRGGLTVNPLLFLLVLALIAIFIWRGWLMYDILSQHGSGAYRAGTRMGLILGCVLWPMVCCAIAGAAGIGAYVITGRSDGAANGAIGLVLILGVGFFGYTTYALATQPLPTPAAATRPAPRTHTAAAMTKELSDQMEAAKAAQRQQLERPREHTAAPFGGPTSTAPTSAAETPVNPAGTHLAPPLPRAPSPGDAEADRRAAAALAPVRESVRVRSAEFLAAADPLVAALSKAPRAVRSEVDKRVTECTTLKGHAGELESCFRAIDTEAEKALAAAGVDLAAQVRAKIDFSQSVDGFARAGAAGAYKRLFDTALEEAQTLQENAGKWRLDADGQLSSTDRGLQARLRHLRQVVQMGLRSVAEERRTIAKP